jgi:hypothetical protein
MSGRILACLAALIHLSACTGGYSDHVALNYTPLGPVAQFSISKSEGVSIQFCEPSQIGQLDRGISSTGKKLMGVSKYRHHFESVNASILKQAKNIGATNVVYCFTKSASAIGNEMVLVGETAGAVGFSSSNIAGTITSSLGKTSYNTSSFTSHFIPGSRMYANRETQYDLLDYDIRFYR